RRCFALGQMVRTAVEALPASSKVAVLASGSFSLDVGGHLSPRGQFAGTPDVGWGDTVLGHLQNGRINELLNEATGERMARAGDVGRLAQMGAHGYLLGHFARNEVLGLHMRNYSQRIHDPGSTV